jgi:hypothetical protein
MSVLIAVRTRECSTVSGTFTPPYGMVTSDTRSHGIRPVTNWSTASRSARSRPVRNDSSSMTR